MKSHAIRQRLRFNFSLLYVRLFFPMNAPQLEQDFLLSGSWHEMSRLVSSHDSAACVQGKKTRRRYPYWPTPNCGEPCFGSDRRDIELPQVH